MSVEPRSTPPHPNTGAGAPSRSLRRLLPAVPWLEGASAIGPGARLTPSVHQPQLSRAVAAASKLSPVENRKETENAKANHREFGIRLPQAAIRPAWRSLSSDNGKTARSDRRTGD